MKDDVVLKAVGNILRKTNLETAEKIATLEAKIEKFSGVDIIKSAGGSLLDQSLSSITNLIDDCTLRKAKAISDEAELPEYIRELL